MTITTPLALLFLLLIPVIAYIGWPRNRFRRTRDSVSLILRTVIMTLLVLALAGTQIVQSADRLAVVFLVDTSDSMGATAQEAAQDYIREALPEMRPDDVAGVVAFGAEAQVARSMSNARELGPIRADPATGNTDLAAAIRLGLAMFPGDAARRMVVLTDGQPTIGDTEGAAQLAAAAGVEISYVPYSRPQLPEIQIEDVDVPTVVDEGQEFDMTVAINSEEDTEGVVTVLANGEIVSRQQLTLREGTNNYTLRLQSGSTGFRDYTVQVDPLGDDGFYQNNSLGAFSRVEGASRVLVVGSAADEETVHIIPALEESGLEVDLVAPGNVPLSVGGLTQYESVVLVNVSALELSRTRMQAIETYVSDLGGGLVVVGGPTSYGPGGYFQTPLEDALPVEVQIRDQERLPQLTIAYVIDRSGSMGATGMSGISNIDLAKEAIIRSINFLQPTDRAGVASFDAQAYWVAQIQDVFDSRELQRLTATLRPSGGTDIMAGMQLVAEDIVQEPTQLKHIILLTDGGASPEGLVELTGDLREENNVTTSVISIGQFEAEFLEDMAEAAGGNYHSVTDAASIPEIFASETVLATRTYIQEESFVPTLTANHPIMQNIPALPNLQGYVATTPRAAAQVILRGPEPYRDPLLVAWQYGLGRTVAFTSDATARWGQNWVTWDDFGTFWSQAIRWTITEGASDNLETRIVMEDEQARVIVDARDDDGNFLNGLNLQASVVYSPDPAADARRVTLRQVAPGRYEATFNPGEEGAYFLRVTDQGDTETSLNLNQTSGWVMSYSAEYQLREFDETLLETVAELTEGQNLSETPEAVFDHNLNSLDASVPLWPWLLLAAMVLLPFDIAVRRLLITRSDLGRLSAWAGSRFRRQAGTDNETQTERLSSLREARDRARQRTVTTTQQSSPSSTIGALRKRREADETTASTPPTQAPQPQPTQPAEPPKPRYKRESDASKESSERASAAPSTKNNEEGNIGSRLLKRRRTEDNEDDA